MSDMLSDPSDEVIASTKLLCALVEHSSEWMAARTQEPDLQTLLNMILRLTNWEGLGKAEETVSEVIKLVVWSPSQV